MRDHRKLRAFDVADSVVLAVYRATRAFPRDEQFALTTQMRRAAVSVACNIVEGCARHGEADFLHFLDMAYGSARELDYQISLAFRLGYLSEVNSNPLKGISEESCKVLSGLIHSIRRQRGLLRD